MKYSKYIVRFFTLIALFNLSLTMPNVVFAQGWFECDKVTLRSKKVIKWKRGIAEFQVHRSIWDNRGKREEVKAAVAEWNLASRNGMIISVIRAGSGTPSLGNGKNEIYEKSLGKNTIAEFDYLKSGSNYLSGNCDFKEVDIFFNSNKKFKIGREDGSGSVVNGELIGVKDFSYSLVLSHELGHALAMRHDVNRQLIMMPYYPFGGAIGGLGLDSSPFGEDRRRLRSQYGNGWPTTDIAVSRWKRVGRAGFAEVIDLLKEDQKSYTRVIDKGDEIYIPYSLHNLGTKRSSFHIKFYASRDRIMGSSDDIYLTHAWETLNGGVDKTKLKHIPVFPRLPSRGLYYIGYKLDRISGDIDTNNDQDSLYNQVLITN